MTDEKLRKLAEHKIWVHEVADLPPGDCESCAMANGILNLLDRLEAAGAENTRHISRVLALWAEMFPGKAFPGDGHALQAIAEQRSDNRRLALALVVARSRIADVSLHQLNPEAAMSVEVAYQALDTALNPKKEPSDV